MHAKIVSEVIKTDRKKNLITDPEENKVRSAALDEQIEMVKNKIAALKHYNLKEEKRLNVQHQTVSMLTEATFKAAVLVKQVKQKKKEQGMAGVMSEVNEHTNVIEIQIKDLEARNKQLVEENKEFEKLKEQDYKFYKAELAKKEIQIQKQEKYN